MRGRKADGGTGTLNIPQLYQEIATHSTRVFHSLQSKVNSQMIGVKGKKKGK
jgi:hypothetical protein